MPRSSKPLAKRRPARTSRSGPAPGLPTQTFNVPSDLTPAQYTFCLAYLENGFNATRAYQTAHPKVTYATARIEGSRTLAHPCIRAFLGDKLEAAWKPMQMSADEALARLGRLASVDIRLLFDEQNRLLPVHQWPESMAYCVKSFHRGPSGFSIALHNTLEALRTILEQAGKLKAPTGGVDALAAALLADLEAHKDV